MSRSVCVGGGWSPEGYLKERMKISCVKELVHRKEKFDILEQKAEESSELA